MVHNNLVGIISPRYAPAVGGVERHVTNLAQRLVRRGIRVEVITTDPTNRLAPVQDHDGVLVRRFPTIGNDSVYFLSPQLGWWLSRNAGRYAVLHAHSYHAPLALQAAIAGRMQHVPLVITTCYHGTGHSSLRNKLHIPYRKLGKWMLSEARQVICLSFAEEQLLQRHFGHNIYTTMIPSAVDVARLSSTEPEDEADCPERTILSVGRLEHYKQVERIIEALPHLPPSYRCTVIGSGPAQPNIEATARALGVESRVDMLGKVPEQDLLCWYKKAAVFASLSSKESFGLTVLEAAVAGLPVVASKIPAHAEIGGYLPEGRIRYVDPACEPAGLASAIGAAAAAGKRGDARDWNLPDWEQIVDATLACYQRAMAN